MNVYVPSYNRYRAADMRSLVWLATAVPAKRLFLVVRADQMDQYRHGMREAGLDPLHRCTMILVKEPGVCAARNAAVEHATGTGASKLLLVDDDLTFYQREGGQAPGMGGPGSRLVKCVDPMRVVNRIAQLLDRYAHAAVSNRYGNAFVETPLQAGVRGVRCVGYRVQVLRETGYRFEIPGREGMHMTLRLFSRGYPNAVAYDYAQESCARNVFDHPGQTAEEWTRVTAEALARAHPGTVTLVRRAYKSGPRVEVRVAWAKALAEPRILLNPPPVGGTLRAGAGS